MNGDVINDNKVNLKKINVNKFRQLFISSTFNLGLIVSELSSLGNVIILAVQLDTCQ